MTTFEFDTTLENNQALTLPPQILEALQNEREARAIVIPKSKLKEGNDSWTRLGAERFFRDHDDADSVYDNYKAK
jgi:hypothetical protein